MTGSPGDTRPAWMQRLAGLTLRGLGVVTIVLALYVLASIGFAVYQFGATKAALLSRGMTANTAGLVSWIVFLVASALPTWALARIVLGFGKPLDYAAAMVGPLISWGIGLVPANFDAVSSKALSFCAPTRPDGTRHCSDGPGVDPITGRALVAMTPEAIELELRQRAKLLPEPVRSPVASTIFFDRLSGAPKVWHAKGANGCPELFDNPGVHPQSGAQLAPVTAEVVERARACESTRAQGRRLETAAVRSASPGTVAIAAPTAAAPTAAARAPSVTPPMPAAPDPRARYVDVDALVPGAKVVGFRGDPTIARDLIGHLPQPVAVDALKPPFFGEGLFEQALMGDTSKIRALRLADFVDTIYLFRIEPVRTQTQSQLEGMVFSQVNVRFVAIDPRTGAVLRSSEVVLEGRGFSPQKAAAEVRSDVERKAAMLIER